MRELIAASPEALFATLMATEPARPFVTFYDEGSGERAELSVRSLANWVAKTHFLLSDELALGVGDAAYVDLPADWITVPVLLGCWSAGLEVLTSPEAAAVAFAPAPVEGVADAYAIAPGVLTRSFGAEPPPDGMADYVAAVRPQPDAWASVQQPAAAADPALDGMARSDLVAKAQTRAGELGLEPAARIVTTREWRGADDWVDTLLAPLAVGGSLVLVRGATPEVLARRADQERAVPVE
ncbi:MAG TPA: TIGR03089 family protein [Jatrophihabitantaceae bacterium]